MAWAVCEETCTYGSWGGSGWKIGTYPTKSTEKLIEYKTYLQALPYFDRLEGDREVTESLLQSGGAAETRGETNTTNQHLEYGDDNSMSCRKRK
jgi:hypothetical protein